MDATDIGPGQASEPGPRPPRLHPVRLTGLEAVGAQVVAEGDDLDDVEIRGLRSPVLEWTGRRRLSGSLLADLAADEWHARAGSFADSVLDAVAVVALSAPDSGWRSVEVRSSRIGSVELHGAELRNVSVGHCKLGYVNLRGARLTDVSFGDCLIDELDLGGARLERVAFPGTRIGRLLAPGARLTDVDLRGSRVDDLDGVEGLRGATVSLDQLLDLAPMLAARLGILVD